MTVIRLLRVLRPLKTINKFPSLRVIVSCLLSAIPMLINVMILCTCFFVIFGLMGVQTFGGHLRNRCSVRVGLVPEDLEDPVEAPVERSDLNRAIRGEPAALLPRYRNLGSSARRLGHEAPSLTIVNGTMVSIFGKPKKLPEGSVESTEDGKTYVVIDDETLCSTTR